MSGKLLVGIAVGAMILGPYRITADEKKPEVVKITATKEQPKLTLKETSARSK